MAPPRETCAAPAFSEAVLQRCSSVHDPKVNVESTVFASNSSTRHCNQHHDTLLRWGLVSRCTRVPQRRPRSRAHLEQSSYRTAADGRDHGPQQHFWAVLMVQIWAIPPRSVRPFEHSEDFFISDLTFAARSNLVCRPKSGAARAAWRQTNRNGRANPTRQRFFGGASSPSSPVRRAACARPRLLAPAERVLFERAQDRVRNVQRLWPRLRRLRTSTFPAAQSPRRTCGRQRPQ